MHLLFLGDIMGRSGRQVVIDRLPGLREQLALDFVVVNAENAASGFGLTEKIAGQLIQAGADVLTGGNHSFDQKDIAPVMDQDARLLRPVNFPEGTAGKGWALYLTTRGKKVLVINAMGQVFMHPVLDNPFHAVERVLSRFSLGSTVDAVIVDMHGEATSEKMAMGHFCDGRASLVVGTHSHVPTGDAQILDGGTAYQTDAGMCGDYNSIIGMNKVEPLNRFTTRMNRTRYTPATGDGTLCGVFVATDDATGRAVRVEPVRLGARLAESIPSL